MKEKILFPEVINSKTPKVYKNRKLNTANFGDFTHTDYQVFLYLITKIGGVDGIGKYLQPTQLERKYVLTAKDFNNIFNTDLSNCYKILKSAIDRLMKTDIKVENIENDSFCRINICSRAEYNKNEGSINVKFTDDIMPYLAQVKEKFVLYNLKEIANFGSLYTTRLYELIQDFKETGWMIKSVDQLREIFAVGNKYKLYGHFKDKTFSHACEEINSNFNIDLKFEEMKEGRKVVAIRFSFNPVKEEKSSTVQEFTNNVDIKLKSKIKDLKKKKLEQLEFTEVPIKSSKSNFFSKEPKNIKSILSSLFSKIKLF